MDRAAARPFLALLIVQFSFASFAVVGKVVLGNLPPLVVAGIRMFFASLFLAAFALGRAREPVPFPDALKLLGLSLLGIVCNQILFLEGLSRTTAVDASILIATIPVFTTTLAILAGKESPRPVRLLGIGVALAGALTLLDVRRFSLSDETTLGNLFIVLNAFSYSIYLVFSRPLLGRYRSSTVVAWTFLFGALIITPLSAVELGRMDLAPVPQATWWGMAWVILVPSVLAYSLNNYALKRIHASTVATWVFLQPLVGVALAVAFLDETFGVRTALAGVLIVAGVVLVSRSERYEPVAAIPESGEAMSREPLASPDGRAQPEPQEDHPGNRRQEAP